MGGGGGGEGVCNLEGGYRGITNQLLAVVFKRNFNFFGAQSQVLEIFYRC